MTKREFLRHMVLTKVLCRHQPLHFVCCFAHLGKKGPCSSEETLMFNDRTCAIVMCIFQGFFWLKVISFPVEIQQIKKSGSVINQPDKRKPHVDQLLNKRDLKLYIPPCFDHPLQPVSRCTVIEINDMSMGIASYSTNLLQTLILMPPKLSGRFG